MTQSCEVSRRPESITIEPVSAASGTVRLPGSKSGECRTVNGSVGFHGILPNITCVGNLFCQYNNFQTHVINFSISISTSR